MIFHLVSWAARTSFGRILIGILFRRFTALLPVKRYFDNRELIAFQHPKPCYPIHILIVPKKALTGLEEMSQLDHNFFLMLMMCVSQLVEELGLRENGYKLIINGGAYQVILQFHLHLIAE